MAEVATNFGLTVEDVNTLQDEMNRLDEDPESKEEVKEATKVEEPKVVEEKPVEKKIEEKAEEKVEEKTAEEEIDPTREMREQLKQYDAALQKLTADYQKLQKSMVDKGIVTDEDLEKTKAEEEAAKAYYTERVTKLNEMVAMMEINPTFSDVRDVCTQGNLDDVVDAFSRHYVSKNGGDRKEVAVALEAEIWAKPNPYKEMYEVIKKYHPKYSEKKEEKVAEKVADKKEVKDVTPSAATMGAGGSGAGVGGWTSARIDALAEDELSTVPKDIYSKYLLGTLK
jgi:hypothetical protein